MKTRFLLSMAAAAALVIGAPAIAQTKGKGCKANCSIDVVVTADATSCKITAPAKTHQYFVAATSKIDVTWKLKAPKGYEFPADAIKFTKASSQGVFRGRPGANKQEFIHADDTAAPGAKDEHPYTIAVQGGPNGSIKCDLDPSIVNE